MYILKQISDSFDRSPLHPRTTKCIVVGGRKNKKRIPKPIKVKKKKITHNYCIYSKILQACIIWKLIDLYINMYCFNQCREELREAMITKMTCMYQDIRTLGRGWLIIDVVHEKTESIVVHEQSTIQTIIDEISDNIIKVNASEFYIRHGTKHYHVSQNQLMKIKIASTDITNGSKIHVIRRLYGGGKNNKKRKRSDKEEMDATSDEDSDSSIPHKIQRLSNNIIEQDHQWNDNNSTTIDVEDNEEIFENDWEMEEEKYQTDDNENWKSDEEYLPQNFTTNAENIFDELCDSEDSAGWIQTLYNETDESDESEDSEITNTSETSEPSDHSNESDSSIRVKSQKPNRRKPGQKKRKGPKRTINRRYNKSHRYNINRLKRQRRLVQKSLAPKEHIIDEEEQFDWDSKIWAKKIYHKQQTERKSTPLFQMKGGIDKFRSDLHRYKENYIGKMDNECPHCGALLFKCELSKDKNKKWTMCCNNGKIKLKPRIPPPKVLQELLTSNTNLAKYFKQHIILINSALALSSSKIYRKQLPHSHNRAPPTFILSGGVYHTVPLVVPDEGKAPKQAQIYTWDPDQELNNRMNQGFLHKLKSSREFRVIVKQLQNTLHQYNWIVKTYKTIYEKYLEGKPEIPELKLMIHSKIDDKTNLGHYKQYSEPSKNSPVATIMEFGELTDKVPTHRKLIITTRNTNETRTLLDCHSLSDAYAFPLFYPYGETAYDIDFKDTMGKKISMTQYYRYRLLERKNEWNPFIYGGRLFQQFISATWGKIQQNTMNWIIHNQKKCRADSYESIKKARNENDDLRNLGKKLNILPRSFVESPRYFRSKYQHAIAILRQMRSKPDFFITFTANEKWREIQETLAMHESPMTCRDDIIARVFHAKLKQFLHDLTHKNGLGMYIIIQYRFQLFIQSIHR